MFDYPIYLKSNKTETWFVYFDQERYIMLSKDTTHTNFETWSVNWGINYMSKSDKIPFTSQVLERKIYKQVSEEEFYEKFMFMFEEFDKFRGIQPTSAMSSESALSGETEEDNYNDMPF